MSRTMPQEGDKNKITGMWTTLPKDNGFLSLICASSQDASWRREGWTERCLCLRDPNDSPINWNGRLFVLFVSIGYQFYSRQVKNTRSYFGVSFCHSSLCYHTHTTIQLYFGVGFLSFIIILSHPYTNTTTLVGFFSHSSLYCHTHTTTVQLYYLKMSHCANW